LKLAHIARVDRKRVNEPLITLPEGETSARLRPLQARAD
jgi:hypothetical protein